MQFQMHHCMRSLQRRKEEHCYTSYKTTSIQLTLHLGYQWFVSNYCKVKNLGNSWTRQSRMVQVQVPCLSSTKTGTSCTNQHRLLFEDSQSNYGDKAIISLLIPWLWLMQTKTFQKRFLFSISKMNIIVLFTSKELKLGRQTKNKSAELHLPPALLP